MKLATQLITYYSLVSLLGVSLLGYAHNNIQSQENKKTVIVEELQENNVQKSIQESKKTIVIDFYADWCAPCKTMSPLFEQFAQEMKDTYTCYKVNFDNSPSLALEYKISSLPTFVVIKDNEIKGKISGTLDYETLKNKINASAKATTFKETTPKETAKELNTIDLSLKLLEALQSCSIEEVKKYIQAGANVKDPIKEANGITPLMFAVSYCAIVNTTTALEIIDELIKAGADIDYKVVSPMAPEGITARDIAENSVNQLKKGVESYEQILNYLNKKDFTNNSKSNTQETNTHLESDMANTCAVEPITGSGECTETKCAI